MAEDGNGYGGGSVDDIVEDRVLDHVIGSAAEVERLWSVAKHILTESRSGLAPIVFESILFLRFNRELWNEFTVIEAWNAVRAERKDERLQLRLEAVVQQAGGDEDGDDGQGN